MAAQQPGPVIDHAPRRELIHDDVAMTGLPPLESGVRKREVRDADLLTIAQRQPGVGRHEVSEPATLAVELDKPLGSLAVVRVAAIVVSGHKGHLDCYPGEVGQRVIEPAERDVAEVPQLIAVFERRRGAVHQIYVHVIDMLVRAPAEPDDVLVPVVSVGGEEPHPSSLPETSDSREVFYRPPEVRRGSACSVEVLLHRG